MKKIDKIVIAVGVVVIIIAAIGIWYYSQLPIEEEPEEVLKTFDVMWEERQGSLTPIEGVAYDKVLGKDEEFNETILIPVSNIREVTFTLTWEDDRTFGLKNKGRDTLTFSVISPDGEEIGSEPSVGNGTIVFTAVNPESPDMVSYIEAESIEEAERILDNYTCERWKNEPFELHVKVKVGETILRPLKRLKDKGNNFTIDITYTYYQPILTEEEPTIITTSVEYSERVAIGAILTTGYGFR
jgi:hypothetical protein